MEKQIRVFACLLALLPARLAAQAPNDINAKFQALEQRIKALESEVSTLKAALAAVPETQPPAPAQPGVSTSGGPQSSEATAPLVDTAISIICQRPVAAGAKTRG